MRLPLALGLVRAPMTLAAQGTPTECCGLRFGTWQPTLSSVASTYNPGYDPKASAPAGSPRDWATRIPNGPPSESAGDSVLMLFPAWWPVGVAIEWKEQRGDTLVGVARALVADGRLKNPETSVRAVHVACSRPDAPKRDTASTHSS